MEKDLINTCQYRKCGKPSEIVYLGRGLCEKHWQNIAAMDTEQAHKLLKIKRNKNEQISSDSDITQETVPAAESVNVTEDNQEGAQSS